ncbi:hypothetical protein PFFVO_03249 [Plasmodium falciparum Vietnam Oak-Knoll (FVO)]|uniref:Surface antigen n=1 Tax=Plasmodium falciparum Vietnam Oak-Knoll (FVO) TaxID=1036723 RepID=A0A024V6L6_PLAFA|nr:hypothetical protein PFFVO_03249 [Plasmodium falciparum Vietnam Oak-Knoll (FVO)]
MYKLKINNSVFYLINYLVTICNNRINSHNNNNEPQSTPHHTPTTTSRELGECDIYKSIYDNGPDMKSVKDNFDRQTSRRFEEYEERVKDKRQKRKEERDKNIKKIIEKDKMDKSLAEKVEKGCLKCACVLGGVAASVGLFGGLGIYGWKSAATATAMAEGTAAGKAAGEAAYIAEGIKAVIAGLEQMGVSTLDGKELGTYITATNYTNVRNIALAINSEYQTDLCLIGGPATDKSKTICTWVREIFVSQGKGGSTYESIKTGVETIVSGAPKAAEAAVETATKEAIKASTDAIESTYAICQTAIIASVVALLIIVLVMIIIYLVLRYRRKKKMKKKAQYTKLLNQ